MKAISVLQPWASLIACGAKQYETRSWFIKYRGMLAIHAGKRFEPLQVGFCEQEPFKTVLEGAGLGVNVPLGGIVAVVKLVEVHKTTPEFVKGLSKREQAFGDYGPGRFAWRLEVVKAFKKPIPMNGAQGLFEVADSLLMRFM